MAIKEEESTTAFLLFFYAKTHPVKTVAIFATPCLLSRRVAAIL
jgi:hypothetical protein